ncbi:glutathione S-transferase C-terminal-like protein, partial [Atractiella rhizophila]
PWKVAIVLECLGLNYEHINVDILTGEHKRPAYTKLNPNGRIPALVDHKNKDMVVWESNAILQYLVDRYDTEEKFSATTDGEKAMQAQYLFFQASGQGPYYGQYAWFAGGYHGEQLPTVTSRYEAEINRVLSVLEAILSKQEWLVGSKCTIADLSFLMYNLIPFGPYTGAPGLKFTPSREYPKVTAWHERMVKMEPVKKVLDQREAIVQEFMKKKFGGSEA